MNPQAAPVHNIIQTADVGVQTISTAITRFPEPSRSHVVPWGLDTEEPSPLTFQNNIIDHIYNNKMRKLEDPDSTCPPRKKPALDEEYPEEYDALDNEDHGSLDIPWINNNDQFLDLNFPLINNEEHPEE